MGNATGASWLAVVGAWLAFMVGLVLRRDVEDAVSFASGAVIGAALVFLGFAAAFAAPDGFCLVTAEARGKMGLRRLFAQCHPEHRASWRVLEKCGFTRAANDVRQLEFPNLMPGVLQEVLCYELVREMSPQESQ